MGMNDPLGVFSQRGLLGPKWPIFKMAAGVVLGHAKITSMISKRPLLAKLCFRKTAERYLILLPLKDR